MSVKYLGVRQLETVEIKSVYPEVKKQNERKQVRMPLYQRERWVSAFLGFSGKSLAEMHGCPSCPCEGWEWMMAHG